MRSSSGRIIFATVQKFSLEDGETAHPSVCERTNVLVICHDEKAEY